jgi:DNA repair protein RadB
MAVKKKISTGSRELDRILGGGITRNNVTFVYGEPASGKTTLAMSLMAYFLITDPLSKTVFIDSDLKFNTERFLQIIDGKSEYLKRLLYWKPSSFEDQASILQELPEKIDSGDLVIIDSITGLYRLEAGNPDKTFAENKELNYQLGLIKEMAETKEVTVILTGQVRSIIDSALPQVEPVAPRLLRFWSDIIIKLENTSIPSVRQAILEKPKGGVCRFGIGLTGITEVELRR